MVPIPTGIDPSGSLIEPLECILFDVYGTLFISASGGAGMAQEHTPAIAELGALLQDYGISRPTEKLLADFYQQIEHEHQRLHQKGVDFPEVDIEGIWHRILSVKPPRRLKTFAMEFEMIVNPVYPMPHLAEMLAALQSKSILTGLISNAQFYTPYLFIWFLNADLTDLGFAEDLILFSYRFGHAKPSPVLFRTAADNLEKRNIAPSATLYVGNDMLNDIYAARKCGFQTALFAGDDRSLRLREDDARCRNLQPNLVITDLEQILNFVPR